MRLFNSSGRVSAVARVLRQSSNSCPFLRHLGVAKQKAQLERLKKDCAKELVNVEVAQRTKDTPPALQYENNNGPIEYFNR